MLRFLGFVVLVGAGVYAFGGLDSIWRFTKTEAHRFTSMALLTGTLRLRGGVSRALHDEQVYDGAVYTNWGFGVPLLQAPFHALARWSKALPTGFFPDRAIYFVYLVAAMPVLWAAFDRLLRARAPLDDQTARRNVLSWSATLLALTSAVFPLISARFIVYEETISYLVVFELFALSAYIFSLRSTGLGPVAGMAAASGVGLLVRPTALVHASVWGLLTLLERRTWKAALTFVGVFAPFAAFWLVSNWIKAGSPLSSGYENSLPGDVYHTTIQRFGSPCADTPVRTLEAAGRLFTALFANHQAPLPHMARCPDFEMPPTGRARGGEPFLGFLVLMLLVGILGHTLVRRDRRVTLFVPFFAMALMFGFYVVRGQGFAWRYVGDFWPLILLVCVQAVDALPPAGTTALGLPLASVFLTCSLVAFWRTIGPSRSSIETLDAARVASMDSDFRESRWSPDPPLASRIECALPPRWPLRNGLGWGTRPAPAPPPLFRFPHGLPSGAGARPACAVDEATNVFLGVPRKADDRYELRFQTTGFTEPTRRVYVNGRVTTARLEGDTYTCAVDVPYAALTSPIVMATVEWGRLEETPAGELLSVTLE